MVSLSARLRPPTPTEVRGAAGGLRGLGFRGLRFRVSGLRFRALFGLGTFSGPRVQGLSGGLAEC